MNWKMIKGYILVATSGLIMIAAVLLMIKQGGEETRFKLYFVSDPVMVDTGMLVLFAAVGGIVLMSCLRMMVNGMHNLKRGRQELTGHRRLSELIADQSHDKP